MSLDYLQLLVNRTCIHAMNEVHATEVEHCFLLHITLVGSNPVPEFSFNVLCWELLKAYELTIEMNAIPLHLTRVR